MSHEPTGVLELVNVTKRYGGLAAVAGISLTILEGARHGIIGPNGAGKTTLFKLISGEVPLSHGSIRLFGHDITRMPPYRRAALRLGRTYQITNVFQQLTVEENGLLAVQGNMTRKFDMFGRRETAAMRARVADALAQVGLAGQAQTRVRELGYGQQRQLELALVLASDPRVILLDEPAAGLSPAERSVISDLVRALPADLTVVLIEHDMDLALKLVSQVTCMHNGECIAQGTPDEIRRNTLVQSVYLGDVTIRHA